MAIKYKLTLTNDQIKLLHGSMTKMKPTREKGSPDTWEVLVPLTSVVGVTEPKSKFSVTEDMLDEIYDCLIMIGREELITEIEKQFKGTRCTYCGFLTCMCMEVYGS